MTGFTKNVTDTVGVTDTRTRVLHDHRSMTDTVGVVDGINRTFTLPLVTINVTPHDFLFGSPTFATPTPAGQQTEIVIEATDKDGNVYAVVGTALLASVTWSEDQTTEAQFSVSIDDPNVAELPLPNSATIPQREVRIWRNGQILLWGPVTARRADSTSRVYTYAAKDPTWYLSKRNVGPANRHNFLQNGNYDSAFAHWTQVGTLTPTIDSSDYAEAPQSAQLVAAGTGENYLYQQFVVTAGELGLAMFLRSWVKVDVFNGPAAGNKAAVILRVGKTGPGSIGISKIDTDTPREKFIPLDGVVHMPPFATEVIEVRTYAINGTVHYGANTVTIEQSLGFGPAGNGGNPWDQVTIFHRLVQYFAGRDSRGPEKSDVGIGSAGDLSGIVKERVYQFFDHQAAYQNGQGSGALDQFLRASDGFGMRMEYTENTRTLWTYFPSAGTMYDDIQFVWVKDPTNPALDRAHGIVGWDLQETIEPSANEVIELGGWGSGASREEGGYTNAASLGGLTLEFIESAPNDTPIDALNGLAAKKGAQLENVVATPTLTLAEPRDPITNEVTYTLIGKLMPGDTIPVHLADGDVAIDGDQRIAQVVYDRATETLKVTPDVVNA